MRKLKNANISKHSVDNHSNSFGLDDINRNIKALNNQSNSENQIKEGSEQMIVKVTGIQYNPYGKTLFCVEKNEPDTEYYAGRRVITAYCKDTVEVNINDEKTRKILPQNKKVVHFQIK